MFYSCILQQLNHLVLSEGLCGHDKESYFYKTGTHVCFLYSGMVPKRNIDCSSLNTSISHLKKNGASVAILLGFVSVC